LHLLHVFSTFSVGGQQTRFTSLVNALGSGYRHTVLSMDGRYDAADAILPGVDCSFQKMPVTKSGQISIANLHNARRLLAQSRPDILCTYNWGSIEWALANAVAPYCPQIHMEDGFGPDETPDRQLPRRVMLRRLALRRCAAVIVPSHVLEKVALEKWRVPRQRLHYLPNGVDCGRFARTPDDELVASLGIAPGELVVGTVTALRPEKNLQRLVHIFAELPKTLLPRLVIVGQGPERATIEGLAASLGVADRLVMTGAMANPERILGRFDVFGISSDTEQMPNSVLEAMAAGLPVLATDVGDIKNMLAPANAAFVLPRDDRRALVNGLIRLLDDAALRASLGRDNRARVQSEFGLDTMVARYDAMYRSVLRK